MRVIIIKVLFLTTLSYFVLGALDPAEQALVITINQSANQYYFKDNPLPSSDPTPDKPIEEDVTFICLNRADGTTFNMSHDGSQLPSTGQIHFMIHGWTDSINANWVPGIFDGYKNYVKFAFFCFVDWSRLALFEYQISVENTYKVGAYLADRINAWGLPGSRFHLIGHSMGAQIAAETGRLVRLQDKLLARIFALDAAGPLYCQPTLHPTSERLDASDAKYVQGIHTADSPLNGCMVNYGTQDFKPNSGTAPQPGCYSAELSYNNTLICSHFKAIEYYRRTLDRTVRYESTLPINPSVTLGLYNQDQTAGVYFFIINP